MQLVNIKDIPGRPHRNSLTAKELRERLFRKSRPQARRLEILDGDQYSKDMGVLWAAYKAGSFNMPTMLSQEDFVKLIEESFKEFQHLWVIDDDNNAFSSKRGPVALVGANSANLIVEPKFLFFKWASKRNALRSVVAFLNMIRNSKKTGVALIRTTRDKMTLPDHLKRYDMLYFVGKSAENEYLYTVRGRGTEIKEQG